MAYRSDVRNTMKAYRKGTLSAPLVGEAPSSKLEARKFAMESAKSALSNMPAGFEMKYNKRIARVNNKLGKQKPPAPVTPPTTSTATPTPTDVVPTPSPNPMPPKTQPPTTNPMPTMTGKGKKMKRLGYSTNG